MEDSNTNDLRDASFSYLRAGEGFEQNDSLSAGCAHHHHRNPPMMSLGRSTTKSSDHDQGEISVFGAERYFKVMLDDNNKKPINKKFGYKKEVVINNNNNNSQVHELQKTRTNSSFRPGTPSSCSEVSWNSQTALLPTLIRNPSQSKKKRAINGKNIFANFSCGGSCSDKKSIYVHENQDLRHDGGDGVRENNVKKEVLSQTDHFHVSVPIKPPQQRFLGPKNDRVSNKEDQHFAFPILSPSVVQASKDEKPHLQEEPRKSLEIFGSTTTMKGDAVAINLERKLSMLTWDAIPKSKIVSSTATSPGNTTRMINEDIDSDASSDLFEIENLSGGTGLQPFFTRQVSDGISGCMTPTSRYEPSEASIDWSVVTSSAFGGGSDVSFVTDNNEKKLSANTRRSSAFTAKSEGGLMESQEVMQRSKASGLLGCKSHRAVRVAESTAYRTKDHKAMMFGKVTD